MQRKNKKYLEFIRNQDCLVCHRSGPNDPHHIRQRIFVPDEFRGGVGLKPYDVICLPLCRTCHTKVHEHKSLIDNPGFEIIRMLVRYIDETVG